VSLRNIYEQLGIEPECEKEVAKLNNRIILIVDNFNLSFYKLDRIIYEKLLAFLPREFVFLIGESHINRSPKDFFKSNKGTNTLRENILNLKCLLEASKQALIHTGHGNLYGFLVEEARRAIESPPIDIGYLFSGDTIIKKGAKELDEKLILDNLTWLSKYPTTRQLFETSLKHYLKKDYPDAYASLEGLVKTFLGKDKLLDNDETRNNLINKLA
jgi:hypothetical protein